MKVVLLEVCSTRSEYINKDVMGEYGMVAQIGDSIFAKILEAAKKRSVNIPVFALGYLAAILKKNGHQVEYKFNAIPLGADLVIIPSSIVDYKYEVAFARKIKKANAGAKVGFFGPFASVRSDLYLAAADFVIVDEPEQVVDKISDHWIPQGKVMGEKVADLDTLPFPAWDIFPLKKYSYRPLLKSRLFVTVLSSRGCTFSCSYCPYKAYYGHLRQRSAASVIEELKHLKKIYGIKSVQFRDPLFTGKKDRVNAIADGMIADNLNIKWGCETHVNCLDHELIDKLYAAGLRSINLGIESWDIEMLNKSSRLSASKAKEEEIIGYCQKKGIRVAAFYIFGWPEDTVETIKRTVDYAKKLNTIVAQFFILTPFPGTAHYRQMADDIIETDWEKFNSFTPVFKHPNLSGREFQSLKEQAFVSYYFRFSYLIKHWFRILF
ncbi:MAG: Radical SAM domain protein [Parcubacteria group bacterium GW2011_GWC2_42_12]|uniref:Radical SAM core domain-containing protein n=1 Tax=Candidatus Falkowbacteria bacterium RIFCSPHIGHO2_02_FULL_42_9 TaxID=1797986 RepID=A0A1F5SA46_9BACT|nr:MAG: Radical SAM domain protein [Parcubacteria group bacterium GW2011_GWC2_42_12]OGF23564.1 MAG: hypothetical protein A3D45_00565 [Candidatus Falkowbacteria bacterium RIFCSPHIGHO2_02_FULL_42_9]